MLNRISRRTFLSGSAATIGLGLIPQSLASQKRPRLPIPRLIDGRQGEPVNLTIKNGHWSFMPGVNTATFGFSQEYLGPTIRTRRNSELNLSYHNTLNEDVSVHGHGLHVPGAVDGGPQLEIQPNEYWKPTLSIVQPAATCWYHSHTHGHTGRQVYHGLAGMMIIDDDDSDEMDLPDRYGVDDLPIIIQDKSFDKKGKLIYSLYEAGEDGWYGDTAIINGAINPIAKVPAGKVRLRLLNGANARFYIITFSDNREFYKIATDGGLLEKPVPLKSMEMSPGERCEIIVDLSDGKEADLLTLFEDVFDEEGEGIATTLQNIFKKDTSSNQNHSLKLVVDKSLNANLAPLPERMVSIARPKPKEINRTREFILNMDHETSHTDHSHAHHAMDMTINGAAMDMNVINERVDIGVWERWRIRSNQGAHPFHIHGCSFLIENMEGDTTTADQAGWKDTVVLDDDDWSELIVRFDHIADDSFPYMYHCHILEHEDRGMMGQFTVT
ncbi:multicopper oxidase domain-containing protein [Curvivirga aplysinae]|uniref:multicopper oxidase domain-containing protein n=1 Tax=Curvivirga aplysinae TaxID=2529852 RepID=UPI0012BC77C0|nr:multicopper oxidase domain-containing protein [Curvivirga aplysinae]MTI08447.1 hypothetical protein [Curvivirga aplysinae]